MRCAWHGALCTSKSYVWEKQSKTQQQKEFIMHRAAFPRNHYWNAKYLSGNYLARSLPHSVNLPHGRKGEKIGYIGAVLSLPAEMLFSFGSVCLVRLPGPYVARSNKSFVQASAALQDSPLTLLLDHNPCMQLRSPFLLSPPPELFVKHLCLFPKKQDIWGIASICYCLPG